MAVRFSIARMSFVSTKYLCDFFCFLTRSDELLAPDWLEPEIF